MNFFDAIQTSSSGLTAQRVRMNLISRNLANVNTTRTASGEPYRRKDAVFAATGTPTSFRQELRNQLATPGAEVKVIGIVEDQRPALVKYDPGHPEADAKGYVKLPNINVIEEMVNMMSATRSYEANIKAVQASKSMAMKALEIGR